MSECRQNQWYIRQPTSGWLGLRESARGSWGEMKLGAMDQEKWDHKGPSSYIETLAQKHQRDINVFKHLGFPQFPNVIVHHYHQRVWFSGSTPDILNENFRAWKFKFLRCWLVILMVNQVQEPLVSRISWQKLKILCWWLRKRHREVLPPPSQCKCWVSRKLASLGFSQHLRQRKWKAGTMR